MSTQIKSLSQMKSLSKEELADAHENWMSTETTDWLPGLKFLIEFSARYSAALPKDIYVRTLRRIFEIKPTLRGREEKYFPENFAVPMSEIKALCEEVAKDLCMMAVEGVNVEPFIGADVPDSVTGIKLAAPSGSKKYDVPCINSMERFDQEVDALLKAAMPKFKIATTQRLLTFGSCFALNVGRYLREKGSSVYTLMVAEDVNSTFNNLQLLRRVFLGERSPLSDELELVSKFNYEEVRGEFLNASGIIFTLGNIFHLEVNGTPTLNLRNGSSLVAEKLEETVSCLREIFALLRQRTKATIFVSVSPVPISGYRGDEFQTAIEADCLSKSQLRSALQVCRREYPDLVYIPTFEIFRWLPAHQTFASFGTDDEVSRRISSALIKRVMDKLC